MKLAFAIFFAWLLSQAVKYLKDRTWKTLWGNGGMPSAHAAVVSSLCAGLYVETGFSLLLLMAVVFSLIVLNDALTVRWQTGVQADLLGQLLSKKKRDQARLSKSVGHRPSEVLAGILLGILMVILVYHL